jgi:hypothetical protein
VATKYSWRMGSGVYFLILAFLTSASSYSTRSIFSRVAVPGSLTHWSWAYYHRWKDYIETTFPYPSLGEVSESHELSPT